MMFGDYTTRCMRFILVLFLTCSSLRSWGEVDADYLSGLFGNNRELMKELKGVVSKGMSEKSLNLGAVSGMLVTYGKKADGKPEDVAVRVFSGYPLGQRRPQIIEDGPLHGVLGDRLWSGLNVVLQALGRDMVTFSKSDDEEVHGNLLEEVTAVVNDKEIENRLDRPVFFSLVLPDPRRVVSREVRKHLQSVIIKGYLSR
ncbi:MAG: hypothetical protein AAF492_20575, partial [Verrucomicrobiota bacterium]